MNVVKYFRSADLDLPVLVELALIHNFHHGSNILLDVAPPQKKGIPY